MGGKYEVRYYVEKDLEDPYDNGYSTEYFNSFVHFIKLITTKKVIYYKVVCG